MTIKTINPLF